MELAPGLSIDLLRGDQRSGGCGVLIGRLHRIHRLVLDIEFAIESILSGLLTESNVIGCADVAGVIKVFRQRRKRFIDLANTQVRNHNRRAVPIGTDSSGRSLAILSLLVVRLNDHRSDRANDHNKNQYDQSNDDVSGSAIRTCLLLTQLLSFLTHFLRARRLCHCLGLSVDVHPSLASITHRRTMPTLMLRV